VARAFTPSELPAPGVQDRYLAADSVVSGDADGVGADTYVQVILALVDAVALGRIDEFWKPEPERAWWAAIRGCFTSTSRTTRGARLGSISKSYGLPGLRLGWLVGRDAAIRDAVMRMKDYTTICSSATSEVLAAVALRNRRVLLERNLATVERNLPLLDDFFERHGDTFEWVRPTASPIGFPRVNDVADVDEMCARLADMGVLLLPGSVYDQPAHMRIGFGRANMPDALHLLEACLGAPSTA